MDTATFMFLIDDDDDDIQPVGIVGIPFKKFHVH